MRDVRIAHLVYGGVAGSPRGTLLLAERERPIATPMLVFHGERTLHPEYRDWVEAKGLAYVHVPKSARVDPVHIARIAAALHRFRPDLLFAHGIGNLLYALPHLVRHPTTRVIVADHGPGIHESRLAGAMARVAMRVADACVFVGPHLRDFWRDELGKLPRKFAVIPNGVDIAEMDAAPVDESKTNVTVLMVATFNATKDHATLLEAFGRLANDDERLRLVLVGHGPKKDEIVAQIARLGIESKVHLVINPPRAELVRIVKNSDVFVLSTYGEGLSRSILEAMAARVPVVATDVSGVSGFIRDGVDGLLVPPRNALALGEAIRRLLGDPELRQTLTRNAFEKIRTGYSVDVTVARYITLIKEVCADLYARPPETEVH